ncbi:hypothetical protein IX84_07825 [Phaeodactylibacter xiamenensis]|uniref:Uncharacterized protein n=1 Tax=Phaeodactylibacter xiamenensis TaxID=1524460 RepID=A0A098S7N1_9BACT|nr:hypothetical protein IX84_07825 [Phaeodactylibacter xiamenensis]
MENGKLPIVLPSLNAVAAETAFAESLLRLYNGHLLAGRSFFTLVKCEIGLILNSAFAMHPEEHQIVLERVKTKPYKPSNTGQA